MPLSPERRSQLIREAADRARDIAQDALEAINRDVLDAVDLTGDPVLAARIRQGNRLNLDYWITMTYREPDRFPEPNLTPEILFAARENARAGGNELALEAFRVGQNTAWLHWMKIVFELTDDPEELQAVLDFSARSISYFLDETARALSRETARALEDLAQGSPEQRRALVSRLLAGEPMQHSYAERRLGYRLDLGHQAAIIWSEDQDIDPERIDVCVDALAETTKQSSYLSIMEDRVRRWVWFPKPLPAAAAEAVCPEDIRIAIGPRLTGLDGFRRSHTRALVAQRALVQAPALRRVACYEDVRLIALFGPSPEPADLFVSQVLGDLETAEPHLRHSLRIYLRCGENISRAAKDLSIHRNTLVRHLAQAEDLLPNGLVENRLEVGVALELLNWRAPT